MCQLCMYTQLPCVIFRLCSYSVCMHNALEFLIKGSESVFIRFSETTSGKYCIYHCACNILDWEQGI